MKKFLVCFLSIAIMQLNASPKTLLQRVLRTSSQTQQASENELLLEAVQKEEGSFIPEKPKPFDGKSWEKAFISPDATIYTFDGEVVTRWYSGGYYPKSIGKIKLESDKIVAKNMLFTDGALYVRQRTKEKNREKYHSHIKKVSLENDVYREHKTKRPISAMASSPSGLAIVTTQDNQAFLTTFDTNFEPSPEVHTFENARNIDPYYCNDGEIILLSQNKIIYSTNNRKKVVSFSHSPSFIMRKKINSDTVISKRPHPTIHDIDIISMTNLHDGTDTPFTVQKNVTLFSLDNGLLALGCDENDTGKTVKLFDIETKQLTHESIAENIEGNCAMRLINGQIHIVGDKPEPKSMIIDPRENPHNSD